MVLWFNRSLLFSVVIAGFLLPHGSYTADDDEDVCPCRETCSEDDHEFGTVDSDIADFGIQSACESEEQLRCCPKEPPPTKNLTVPLSLQEICFLTPDELRSAGHNPSEKKKCKQLRKIPASKIKQNRPYPAIKAGSTFHAPDADLIQESLQGEGKQRKSKKRPQQQQSQQAPMSPQQQYPPPSYYRPPYPPPSYYPSPTYQQYPPQYYPPLPYYQG